MKKRILAIFAAVALLAVTAMVASAESGTVTVSGGALAETITDVTLPGVTLDGTDQTTTDTSNAWTAEDATGTGAGWHLTIAASDFGINEVQTVSISGTPTGGDFTLTFGGDTTAAIAYNATAADVDSALELLSSITTVTTTGGSLPGTAVVVTFVTPGAQNIALMTFNDAGLTGGTAPAVSVAETTAGSLEIDISLADQQFGITLVNADVGVVAGNTKPVQTSGSLQDIADSTVKFLTAPTDTGMGDYTLDPDLTLEVRAETKAGTYTNTITVAIVSGP